MLGLFEKKKDPQERAAKSLEKKDWQGLSRAYYDMGVSAMESGDLNSAVLWLSRADTIYSANDETFAKTSKNGLFRKEIVDDCSTRIGTLEDAPLLYNDFPAQVEEKAEELSDIQVRIWGLMSIARLVNLGSRLGALPGCEVLGRLGRVVDIMLESFREPVTEDQYNLLMDTCNALYDLGDSEAFYGGNEIEVPGGPAFQVFDLNGMMGVHLELNGYLDNHLRFISALIRREEPPVAESSMVGCTLLPDYYVRSGAKDLEEVPQIKAEMERIESDYAFLCSGITWEEVGRRVAEYKKLDILQ